MIAYIIRRLMYTVPIVLGVLLLTFVLFSVVGGDISQEIAGKGADAETVAEIRKEFGLDKPLFWSWDSQFVTHFKKAVTFDFGYNMKRDQRIKDMLLDGVGPSLSLMVPMFLGTLVISISLSLIVAYLRGSKIDMIAVVICVAGMSVPYLSFILFGQYFLAYKLNWFPIYFDSELSVAQSVSLPVLIGIVAGLGSNLRFYRTVMLDEMRNDYVRTAFAKGLSSQTVLFKHVLKNAMIPIITNVVMAIPFLILGSLLLERFFGIPGLGDLIISAFSARDYFIINAVVFIMALLISFFTLLTDICYAWVDPRVKYE